MKKEQPSSPLLAPLGVGYQRELLVNDKKYLLAIIKEIMEKDEDVLFAYLYGSHVHNSIHFESDIDVAVYLNPSNIKKYIKKEEELTTLLIAQLHSDKIDLRILNVSPFL